MRSETVSGRKSYQVVVNHGRFMMLLLRDATLGLDTFWISVKCVSGKWLRVGPSLICLWLSKQSFHFTRKQWRRSALLGRQESVDLAPKTETFTFKQEDLLTRNEGNHPLSTVLAELLRGR